MVIHACQPGASKRAEGASAPRQRWQRSARGPTSGGPMYANDEEFNEIFSPTPQPARSGPAVDFTASAKLRKHRVPGEDQMGEMEESMNEPGTFAKTWNPRQKVPTPPRAPPTRPYRPPA